MHIILNLFVIFLFLELLARLIICIKNRKFKFLAPSRNNSLKYSAYIEHPYIGYCKSTNIKDPKFPSNNYGFAGTKNIQKKKEKNIKRIIIFGGSTVEQNDIDQAAPFDLELTWPKVFENEINNKNKKFEVINAGCAGYTILENIIQLITKCIHFKPDYAILYTNINDAWWVQASDDFKEDYSHARKYPNFPKKKTRLPNWIPNLRFLFIYQYTIIFFDKYLSPPNSLYSYIQVKKTITHDYIHESKTKQVFKDYLKTFCGICVSNNIIPILIPWYFDESILSNKALNVQKGWDKEKFIQLLRSNNECIHEICSELKEVKLIDIGSLQKDCFRYIDFVHFSKIGLIKMGELVAKNFLERIEKND